MRVFIKGRLFIVTKRKTLNTNMELATSFTPNELSRNGEKLMIYFFETLTV